MITLIFMDGEYEYDDHIIIFFETLKNHVEDFGCLAQIDLKGIEIKKEEFDNILDMCEGFVKNNEITLETNKRQIEIGKYLGLLLEYKRITCLTMYCTAYGYSDILKYVHQCGYGFIKLIFADCECEYDISSVVFFETLKYHADTFAEIDLRGIEITKKEFDDILNRCCKFVKNNVITEIANNGRQSQIESYLGLLLEHNKCTFLTTFCAMRGHLDILKYAYQCGFNLDKLECHVAAEYGHLECLKYAHEHGCMLDFGTWNTCARAIVGGHIDCLKYAHEHGCPIRVSGYVLDYLKSAKGECAEYLRSLH